MDKSGILDYSGMLEEMFISGMKLCHSLAFVPYFNWGGQSRQTRIYVVVNACF